MRKGEYRKDDGKPRYSWYEEGGVWRQMFAGKAAKEHPKKEHPKKKSLKKEHPKKEHPKRR